MGGTLTVTCKYFNCNSFYTRAIKFWKSSFKTKTCFKDTRIWLLKWFLWPNIWKKMIPFINKYHPSEISFCVNLDFKYNVRFTWSEKHRCFHCNRMWPILKICIFQRRTILKGTLQFMDWQKSFRFPDGELLLWAAWSVGSHAFTFKSPRAG